MVNLTAGDVGRFPAASSVSATDTALILQNGALVRGTPAQIATGGGDVVGPATSVDTAIATFSGTTGKLLATPPTITASGGNLNMGASGTQGTATIFAATASKGKVTITTSDNSGNTTTNLNFAAQAGARTVTIPDGGQTNVNALLSEGPQTINGIQTFGAINLEKATNAITAHAGGGQGSATTLTSSFNSITVCATAGDSVVLPIATAGKKLQVSNLGVAYANVFPGAGDLIDALAANTAVSLPAGGSITFTCAVAGSWKSTPIPYPAAQFVTNTTTTTFAAGQLTGAATTVYHNTGATPGSIATRTATQMFADDPYARVGASYLLRIVNAQGTGTLTVTAGSGVTLTGIATIAINTWRDFVVTYTSATALVMQNIATGTFS